MSEPETSSARSLREFLATETGSAGLLLAATLLALLWANSPWSGSYDDAWHTPFSATAHGTGVSLAHFDLQHWVNDGLMAFFFYMVGLEIRRELAVGELRDRRAAAVPALAAAAGMVVPALLYVAITAGSEAVRGWGIVMATDIAFALGALALIGSRVPPGIRVFLLTLAIVDDIGAIAVIAAFYSHGISLPWLAAAGALLAIIGVLSARAERPWPGAAYAVAGVALWYATLQSGIHPTIAGVALGLITPVAVGEGFEHRIHPWTSYLIVPVFALANAGVELTGGRLGDALGSTVTIAIITGLVLGKLIGVTGSTLLAARAGVGPLPDGANGRHVTGVAGLAGIGFTVALFVTDLAFTDAGLRDEAKVGVLLASVLAAAIGLAVLATARPVARRD